MAVLALKTGMWPIYYQALQSLEKLGLVMLCTNGADHSHLGILDGVKFVYHPTELLLKSVAPANLFPFIQGIEEEILTKDAEARREKLASIIASEVSGLPDALPEQDDYDLADQFLKQIEAEAKK